VITLPLLQAGVVDANGHEFTAEALQRVVDDWHKTKSVATVARDFTPNPRSVGRVVGMHFDGATLWVELDQDCQALVEAEGLEAAAGGYFKPGNPIELFTLDRVALVDNKVT